MRVFGESGVGVAADGNDLDLKPRDRRQNAHQLFGFTARAQCQDDVAVGHHAEVAMQRVERIQNHRGRSRAGQCRRDLASNMPGFTDANDDYFAARIHRVFNQSDRAGEIIAQPLAKPLEL